MDKWTYIGILIIVAVIVAVCSKPAQAQNEYLNYDNHCSGITLEPYMEYSQTENMGRGSSTSGYDDNRGTIGLRLRIPLQSTCSKKYRKTMNENMLLRQQLEMLKLCGRYKDLDLGPEFALVKEKCKGVKLSNDAVEKRKIQEEKSAKEEEDFKNNRYNTPEDTRFQNQE
jgi:hypothetical protein